MPIETGGEPHHSLAHVVERALSDRADVVLVTPEGALTGSELLRLAGAVAAALAGTDGPVCVPVRGAVSVVRGVLGALMAGRSVVVVDPHLGTAAIAALLDRAGATSVLDEAGGLDTGVPTVACPIDQEADHAPVPVRPDAPAWHSPTSGSTGPSRVVVQTHREVRDTATRPHAEDDPTGQDTLGLMLGTSVVRYLLQHLARGGRVVVGNPRHEPASAIAERFRSAGATYLRLVPTSLRRLCTDLPEGTNVPSLRRVASLGEQLRWSDVALVRGRLAPSAQVINRYGMTEAPGRLSHTVDPEAPTGDGAVPIGRPRRGVRAWVDAGDGVPAPAGVPGEIVLEGPFARVGVAYEELPDGTRRYRTRDRGVMDEAGDLTFLGRLDRLVKLGGVRVELADLEGLLRGVAGVRDACVVVREPGDGSPAVPDGGIVELVAHVVIDPAAPPGEDDLVAAIAGGAHRSAVPRTFHRHTEPFPTVPSGKVDLRRLAAGV